MKRFTQLPVGVPEIGANDPAVPLQSGPPPAHRTDS
jgi:hypothetical protein